MQKAWIHCYHSPCMRVHTANLHPTVLGHHICGRTRMRFAQSALLKPTTTQSFRYVHKHPICVCGAQNLFLCLLLCALCLLNAIDNNAVNTTCTPPTHHPHTKTRHHTGMGGVQTRTARQQPLPQRGGVRFCIHALWWWCSQVHWRSVCILGGQRGICHAAAALYISIGWHARRRGYGNRRNHPHRQWAADACDSTCTVVCRRPSTRRGPTTCCSLGDDFCLINFSDHYF